MSDNAAIKAITVPGALVEGTQAPAVPAVEQPREDDGRFAQLSRKEKALRQQATQLKADRDAFEAERSQHKPVDWKGRLKTDFAGAIAEAGLTHEEITQQLLNTSSSDLMIKQLQSQILELKAQMGDTTNKIDADKKSAFETAKAQVSREVKLLIDTDEAYETVRSAQAHDAVVELIVQTYQEDGIFLSAEEAAQQIEEHLLEEAVTLAKSKKVLSRLAPTETANTATTKPSAQKNSQTQQTQTLTNAAVTNSAPLSAKERRQRAIMAFQGQLKQ